MPYRLIQIHFPLEKQEEFQEILKDPLILDNWQLEDTKNQKAYSILVGTNYLQHITDKLHKFMGIDERNEYIGLDKNNKARMVILPVEAVLPKPQNAKPSFYKSIFAGISRDELYNNISKGADINKSFILLVIFSTIVASIGLLTSNVAVIIGAMVIAPMLAPNLALALAAALGDSELMFRALRTNAVGFLITFLFSYILGIYWPSEELLNSNEILLRSYVGIDSIILALVSGAAGVVSLTTGISGVLVGVMVAVAILPPAVTFGIMLGADYSYEAFGALLLLAVNVVCVNLSAKLVFLSQSVSPRTWYEKKKAKKAMIWYIVFWIVILLLLILLIKLH